MSSASGRMNAKRVTGGTLLLLIELGIGISVRPLALDMSHRTRG
jgi:hypothetical protein